MYNKMDANGCNGVYIRGMKWMLYKMDLQVGLHTRRAKDA
jgi:hypothetical protein